MWNPAYLFCFVLVLTEVSGVNSTSEPIMGRKCPIGWQKFGSQCFKFVKEQKTWAEAEQHCIELGGNLAPIHNQVTHNYLKSLVKKEAGAMTRAWIGGHDSTQDFIWFWSDGSRFVYKDWHTGEPNNGGGSEKCVEMGYGEEQRWNDARCSTKLWFLCYRVSRIEL